MQNSISTSSPEGTADLLRQIKPFIDAIEQQCLVADTSGKILAMNEAFQQLMGQEVHPGSLLKMANISPAAWKRLLDKKDARLTVHFTLSKGHSVAMTCRVLPVPAIREKWYYLISSQQDTTTCMYPIRLSQQAQLDSLPFQAWIKDEHGTYIGVNQKFAQYYGLSCREIIGKKDQDFLSEEEAALQSRWDAETIAYRRKNTYETSTSGKKGVSHWQTVVTPIIDDKVNLLGISGIRKSITKDRNARLKMERLLYQYQLLSEVAYAYSLTQPFSAATETALALIGKATGVSRVYLFEDDESGEYTTNTHEWVNDGIAPQKDNLQRFPYAAAPSWKRMLQEEGMIYATNIAELPQDVVEVLAPQEIYSILVYPLYVNNAFYGFLGFDDCTHHRVWEDDEISLLKTVTHIIANSLHRHMTTKALQASERKYRELVEMLPEMICETDRHGNVTVANRMACEKLGLREEAIAAGEVNVLHFFPEHEHARIQQNFQLLAEGQKLQQGDYEYQALDATGHLFPALVYVSVIKDHTGFAGVRGVMVDISEQKANERRLNEAKVRAEEASKAKQDFLATMSHEIRTPLNAIIGSVHLMQADQEEDGEWKEQMATLAYASQNLLSLINDILDFSKMEAGKLDIRPRDFNLRNVLQTVVSGFRSQAQEKDLHLMLQIGEQVPDMLHSDPDRLSQVLNNLISNAIKFTQEGEVSITVAYEHDKSKPTLIISVRDTGIGIPNHKLSSIWESFTQLNRHQSTYHHQGTGLGLAITQKLIQLLEGKIEVSSKEGEGATFTFAIPVAAAKDTLAGEYTATTDAQSHNKLEGAHILVVEDNKINQKIASKFLDRWNALVTIANDGEEALVKLKKQAFDLILMDLQMPQMDGYTCAMQIRQWEDTRKSQIPILALTASTNATIQERVKAAGMNDFISKPFDPHDLFTKVAAYLHDYNAQD